MEKDFITQTKRVSKSGNGFVIRITRDIVDFLDIDEYTYLELKIKNIGKKMI